MENDKRPSHTAEYYRNHIFDESMYFLNRHIWESNAMTFIRKELIPNEKENVHKWISFFIEKHIVGNISEVQIFRDIRGIVEELNSKSLPTNEDYRLYKMVGELISHFHTLERLRATKIANRYKKFDILKRNLKTGRPLKIANIQAGIIDYYDKKVHQVIHDEKIAHSSFNKHLSDQISSSTRKPDNFGKPDINDIKEQQ